ncbi:MAG: hypothetical protein PUD50_03690 [Eubacteriales bacterium]|nr:hypothetical protein [Eubacteriales bacterium]
MKRWFSLFLAVCLAAACISMVSASAERLAALSQIAVDKPEAEICLPDAGSGEFAPEPANACWNQTVSNAQPTQRKIPIFTSAAKNPLPFRSSRMDKPRVVLLPRGSPTQICHAGRAP